MLNKYQEESLSLAFSRYLLEEYSIATVAGIAFGEDSSFRMSFATSEEEIEEGLEKLKKAIEDLL